MLAADAARGAVEDKPARMHHASAEVLGQCYAATARRAGSEGKLEITATIEADGSVGAVKLPPAIEPCRKKRRFAY